MEKSNKRIMVSTIFALMLMASAFLVIGTDGVAAAQEGDFTYTIGGSPISAATVTGYTGAGGDVTIPSTLGGYATMVIAPNAFYSQTNLTKITIPNSVIMIGYNSFSGCTSLSEVIIPDSAMVIGAGAFSYCYALTSIDLPVNITTIGTNAFFGCTTMTAINVDPDNMNFLSYDGVLYNKTMTGLIQCPSGKIGTYTLPETVTSISSYALYCPSLDNFEVSAGNPVFSGVDGVLYDKDLKTLINFPTGRSWSVSIPASVNKIGASSFYASKLTEIAIPSTVTSIGAAAFSFCTNLTSIELPESIHAIEANTFSYCSSLKSIGIPNSVTSIGTSAFAYCSSLTSVTIGSGVMTIGSGTFRYCSSLSSISFAGLVAPTTVGTDWILNTSSSITGHASSSSNFPQPGGIFYNLTMGEPETRSSGTPMDLVTLMVVITAIAAVLVALFMFKRRKK